MKRLCALILLSALFICGYSDAQDIGFHGYPRNPEFESATIAVVNLGTLSTGTQAVTAQVNYATIGSSAAVVFNLSGCSAGTECKKVFYLTNPGNSGASIAWQYGGAAKIPKYVGGVAPTYTAAGVDTIIVTSIDGGTTLNLFVVGQDVK